MTGTKTMLAARFVRPGEPLQVVEVPVPRPGPSPRQGQPAGLATAASGTTDPISSAEPDADVPRRL